MTTPTSSSPEASGELTGIRLDAGALRVLAHPLRSRLLSTLRVGGPATATDLAAQLGTNSGATSYTELLAKNPEKAVEKAVRGMLPRTTLGKAQLSKLKVYRGAEHPHAAQQPTPFELTQVAQ